MVRTKIQTEYDGMFECDAATELYDAAVKILGEVSKGYTSEVMLSLSVVNSSLKEPAALGLLLDNFCGDHVAKFNLMDEIDEVCSPHHIGGPGQRRKKRYKMLAEGLRHAADRVQAALDEPTNWRK